MSFWSKLGLADAAALAAMREEIFSLRQENAKLHATQAAQTQQVCDDVMKTLQGASEREEKKASDFEEQLKELRLGLELNIRTGQREILAAGQCCQDSLMQQMAILQESQKVLKEDLSAQEISRKQALAQIVELFEGMRAIQEQVSSDMNSQFSELKKMSQEIADELDFLKIKADMYGGDSKRMAEQLASGQVALQKMLSRTQGAVEEISFLKQYMESLWEAMKLVWINDLLDEAKGR